MVSTLERPRPPRRLVLIVVGGLAAGSAAGLGVGVGLYPPAVGVALAIAAGALTGISVRRTLRAGRPKG